MNYQHPIPVAANALVSQSGELLMGLRSDCMQWELPGGKVDMEFAHEAAKREMREETGMELTLGNFIGYGETIDDRPQTLGRRYLMLYFGWVEWEGFPQRVEEDKCLQWRWFKPEELPKPENVTPGTLVFLEKYLPMLMQQSAMYHSQKERAAEGELETIKHGRDQ